MKKAAENNYIQRGFSFDPENVAAAAPLPELLSELAQNLVSDIARRDPEHSQELLSGFVSELFLAATQQSLREKRRRKQAEGIAKAKAKGVHFGPRAKPLPENFMEAVGAWRGKRMTLEEAAKSCGMARTTFYDAARKAAQEE